MRIVHISDVHLRNLKYHPEYRKVFKQLVERLKDLKPDLIVNTGDSAHTKTQISPEFVEMESEHLRELVKIAPVELILGNHDLNLMNPDRQDAITPIVQSLAEPKIRLHKKSGPVTAGHIGDDYTRMRKPGDFEWGWGGYGEGTRVTFWVFGIADQENYPTPDMWLSEEYSDDINIGLFHGSITGCVTDSNFRMTHAESSLDIFRGLDYVLMGDIHKQQFFGEDRKIAYAGSLVQQNFGEDVEKGFLVWDIFGKHGHNVWPVYLDNPRPFITVDLKEDGSFPEEVNVPPDSRLRIRPSKPLLLSESQAIKRLAKKKFNPHDVIVLGVKNVSRSDTSLGDETISHENLRSLNVQERLIRDFFSKREVPADVMRRIIELNKKYQVELEQRDRPSSNVGWKLERLAWSNLFNYGENNHVDFSALAGLTGIFAPNAAGKSNLIDVIMQTLFDSTTKGVSKNLYLINDNKDQATAVAEFRSSDQLYSLERVIERVKFGARKGQPGEWGKTSVNLSSIDLDSGLVESLNGTSRPETESTIRQKLGTFDDFMLTGLFAQWNASDVIQCKETERKRIFYRFLDLEIFEQKGELAKKESKKLYDQFVEVRDSQIETKVVELQKSVNDLYMSRVSLTDMIEGTGISLNQLDAELEGYISSKAVVPGDVDVEDIEEKIRFVIDDLRGLAREQENITQEMEELETSIGNPIGSKDSIEKLERLLSGKRKEEGSLTAQVENNRKKIVILDQVPCGDSFPTCKYLVDAFDARKNDIFDKANLKNVREEISDLVQRLETAKNDEEQKRKREHLSNLELKLKNSCLVEITMKKNLDELLERQRKYQDRVEVIATNKKIDEKISEVRGKKSKLTEARAELSRQADEINRQIGRESALLEQAELRLKEFNDLKDEVAAYELFVEAMGKDGIAFEILKQKLPLINEEINKILLSAADFSVHVEHDAEEESIKVFIQYGEYRQRLIELASGAEKFLSSIAIRNALMNISSLPRTNMFIIDEGFGKLDPKNFENIGRMFDYLRTVFEHIIVISHSDAMKDLVDNMIEITTDEEGYAHVEVG